MRVQGRPEESLRLPVKRNRKWSKKYEYNFFPSSCHKHFDENTRQYLDRLRGIRMINTNYIGYIHFPTIEIFQSIFSLCWMWYSSFNLPNAKVYCGEKLWGIISTHLFTHRFHNPDQDWASRWHIVSLLNWVIGVMERAYPGWDCVQSRLYDLQQWLRKLTYIDNVE